MAATPDPVLRTEQVDGVLKLILNRPERANALSPELTEALIQALAAAQDVRLCLLQGAGKHFCAGFDLSDIESLSDGDLLWRFLRIEQLLQSVHHAAFPVMAFAQGQAVGAGADLFVACWQRVAAPDARFRMPGWNFELALGTRRLTRLIGQDAARKLLLHSEALSAREALEAGLATKVARREEWTALAETSAQRTSALSPTALKEMLALTTVDSRSSDLAAIVTTAGRPGLKNRVLAYRDRVTAARARRSGG